MLTLGFASMLFLPVAYNTFLCPGVDMHSLTAVSLKRDNRLFVSAKFQFEW